MNRQLALIFSGTCLAVLAACVKPPVPPTPVTKVGFVLLNESGAEPIGGTATFVEREDPIPEPFPGEPFTGEPGVCTVDLLVGAPDEPGPPLPDPEGTAISAGNPLIVQHAGSEFTRLTSTSVGAYEIGVDDQADAPIPDDGLTINVPGGAFQEFAASGFEPTLTLSFLLPADPTAVTPETVFAWNGANPDRSIVILVGGNEDVVFNCIVPDDGSFAFPEVTQDQFEEAAFVEGSLFAAGRMSIQTHVVEDSILLLGILRFAEMAPASTGVLQAVRNQAMALLVNGLPPAEEPDEPEPPVEPPTDPPPPPEPPVEPPPPPEPPTDPPPPPHPPPPDPEPGHWQPAPGTSWQWQLTGKIDTSLDVDMFDIDLFDTSSSVISQLQAGGARVVCYFSAGSWEPWRPDADDFPASVKGNKMSGWDENWLDIRQLELLRGLMGERLDLAVDKGCDGVEPDNVDGFENNTGFPLSYQHQLNYNRMLAEEAHARGLSVGLKNDVGQIKDLEPYFDFAINEECFQWDECNTLLRFVNAGKAVFGVEYDSPTSEFCPEANQMNMDFMRKRLSLDAYREPCR